MKNISISRIVISVVAAATAVLPFVADFNETHVLNPSWPAHAKFHNGQTMTLGLICGLLSLYFLWLRKASTALENLKMGSLFAALYWLAMAPAILYPGTSFYDAGTPVPPLNQVQMDFIIFAVLALCYHFERRRLLRG